ncbi:outer membrane assembly protein AsmA [Edaphovirga cremea]|uniref:outer membrane assembly protein AsmA n=1 Tax=Edaphovirga cremea TaxID=2267246 RepID=UPI003989D806
MRRILTTLVILLIVLVAGMTALVLLVNPNDFRDYMVRKVEQKSGYHLDLQGDLRWHAWPQLSIITGRMSLTAPGAETSVVTAENMRLDVKLWPLLSHQLAVKQVMLKGAVISLTSDSDAQQQPSAPVAPQSQPGSSAQDKWKFDIDELKIVDSLLVWQRADNDQINVREINLSMTQSAHRQAKVSLSSRINRNQRDLAFSLNAEVALDKYPQNIAANVTSFTYQLTGADILPAGIKGQGTLQASYQAQPATLTLSALTLAANDSQLSGSMSAAMGEVTDYNVNLQASMLNLDALSGWRPASENEGMQRGQSTSAAPIIAREMDANLDSIKILNGFTAKLALSAANLTYRGLTIQQLDLHANNHLGKVQIETLKGKLHQGDFSIPGTLDTTTRIPTATLQPVLNNVELGQLLQAYHLPQVLTGNFSMTGELSGEGLSSADFTQHWRGQAQMTMENARLHGLNLQQMIQQAVARSNGSVRGQDSYERFTEVKNLQAGGQLQNGKLKLDDLRADSELLALTGNGVVNLPAETCDMNLNVRVVGGWRGNDSLIKTLQQTDVPLRVYGPWKQLSYQLEVEQLLRKQLQDEAKRALGKWADRNKETQDGKNLKKLLDKL